VNNRRALLLSPLCLIVALIPFIVGGTASAAANAGPETRVRAFDTPTENSVGQQTSETAGGVGCVRPESADLAVGSCVATNNVNDVAALADDVPAGPTFIGFADGPPAAIPAGATGPLPTKSPGIQFTGGSGGPGLDPRVTSVRVMDATAHHPKRIVYMNGQGQTVNPLNGKTIPKNDPWAHIPW
jgi:hypothetical protein